MYVEKWPCMTNLIYTMESSIEHDWKQQAAAEQGLVERKGFKVPRTHTRPKIYRVTHGERGVNLYGGLKSKMYLTFKRASNEWFALDAGVSASFYAEKETLAGATFPSFLRVPIKYLFPSYPLQFPLEWYLDSPLTNISSS